MARSEAYRLTTTDTQDPRIADLRVLARLMGLEQKARELVDEFKTGRPARYKSRYRVVVRARLGKDSPFSSMYRRGGAHYRWSSQTIRPEHGSRFDVYFQEVRTYRYE